MEKINRSQIELTFKFGQVREEYMTVRIVDSVGEKIAVPDISNQCVISTVVDFPGELTIYLDGKNNAIDTLVNDAGVITQDKFVQLTQVKLDRMLVPDYFLQKWPLVNDSFITTYFGFNGTVKLQFNELNSFYWLMKTKN
jgi:hypothetical protein